MCYDTLMDLAAVAKATEHPDVLVAYSFGSAGTSRERPDSDVDVAVIFREDATQGERFTATCEISERVACAAGREHADVVDLARASPLLAHEVLRSGRLLLSKDEATRVRVAARQTMRYIDTRPMRRQLDDGVMRRIQQDSFGRLT
jgi:predicted nucleotidyltransferase